MRVAFDQQSRIAFAENVLTTFQTWTGMTRRVAFDSFD